MRWTPARKVAAAAIPVIAGLLGIYARRHDAADPAQWLWPLGWIIVLSILLLAESAVLLLREWTRPRRQEPYEGIFRNDSRAEPFRRRAIWRMYVSARKEVFSIGFEIDRNRRLLEEIAAGKATEFISEREKWKEHRDVFGVLPRSDEAHDAAVAAHAAFGRVEQSIRSGEVPEVTTGIRTARNASDALRRLYEEIDEEVLDRNRPLF